MNGSKIRGHVNRSNRSSKAPASSSGALRDAPSRRVTTIGGTYEADFLVIALGADYGTKRFPGQL